MNKPIIPSEAGRLKSLCNDAFFGVKRILPKSLRESEKFDKAMAALFGGTAGYVVAKGGEFLINTANHYGGDFSLEKITSHCLAATATAPFIVYAIAPNYLKKWITENPVYSSGTAGVMLGASYKALEVLL